MLGAASTLLHIWSRQDPSFCFDPLLNRRVALYFFRGMSFESLGQNELALKDFKMSVQLDPKFELAVDMVNYLEKK